MTDTVRLPLVLGLLSLVSSAGLSVTYVLTRDEIRRQEQLQRDEGLAGVFGVKLKGQGAERPWRELPARGGKGNEAGPAVYEAKDPTTGRVAYAAGGSGRGYASQIEVIVAVDAAVAKHPEAARIKAVKVVSQADTPGFGSKSQAPEFERQFQDLLLGNLELKRNAPYRDPSKPEDAESQVAAITGATITSNAVLTAVRQAVARIREQAGQAAAPETPESK